MLESHHALVVKALQQLYTHCVNNECFPGDPIDVVDGNPCTHAILDRLGLIKQAEESPETLEGNSPSLSPCWEKSPMSSDSVETNGLSLEPVSSLELSPSSMSALASPLEPDCVKIEPSFGQHHATYSVYYCSDNVWPMQGPPEEFIHSYSTAGFSPEAERIADSSDGNLTYLSVGTANCFTQVGERHIGMPRPCPQEDGSIVYPHNLSSPGRLQIRFEIVTRADIPWRTSNEKRRADEAVWENSQYGTCTAPGRRSLYKFSTGANYPNLQFSASLLNGHD
ncbi:hypothetical protein ACO22_01923 [Paracoccidioides brasiliensis]|uniref:Uncharacterized protein n=1 Tax=Paracoccidioides brasiliensis TaxID=121759 RepID=A0A1D2JKE6_PARBR|nr:hypothetical protein ACO22_01923 [Paracoccidioides brasiliensis]